MWWWWGQWRWWKVDSGRACCSCGVKHSTKAWVGDYGNELVLVVMRAMAVVESCDSGSACGSCGVKHLTKPWPTTAETNE